MFGNLGRTLRLLRELRDLSQGQVARDAGIGKSQLSKYENGKELPKLESLAKVLKVLRLGPYEFFYTMHMLDRRATDLAAAEARGDAYPAPEGPPGEMRDQQLLMRSLLPGNPLLPGAMDQAFSRVWEDLLGVYRLVCEQRLTAGLVKSGDE
ncbi:MAG: helix-turn-helix domain-containing protein [Thermoanaerobaculia bacterium]